ncbi:Asp-tRNA(Asn)/Glu-tRNA(Gln) amidotransferase subunit GatC [Spirochaetia bacterium 38H-sp]|uniref:Aspartyl/glutamyl-tRNA(Asn/Gln) amidotransferase subunit C n=1 Tax=Rarispira pelagica TaxID=3141764 RepID=A0ABU9U912_9SPIR
MDRKELEVTAELASLRLEEADFAKFMQEVEQILAYFEKMEELDVDNLEPTTHALVKKNRVRKDVVREFPDNDMLLDAAPEEEDRYFLIPNVL